MSGLNEKTCDILRKPLKSFTRQGQGGNFSYHKGSDVIRRLNEAFGHSWSSEKVEVETLEEQVLMLVSLSVTIDGDYISHQGYGSADIARSRSGGKALNLGNTYKSAFTNALKKAAEQYGIGLADEEDEVSPARSVRPATPQPQGQYQKPTQSYTQPAPQRFAAPVAAASNTPPAPRPPMSRPEPMGRPSAMPARPSPTQPPASVGLREAAVSMINTEPPAPTVSAPPVNPEPMAKPEVRNDLVSSVQEHALQRLAGMKGLSESELVMGALPKTGKVSFKELLRTEASEVIKYANVQPQGNA